MVYLDGWRRTGVPSRGPEPVPQPERPAHAVRVLTDWSRQRGKEYGADCPCGWNSCYYRSRRAAECAASLHAGAAAGVEQ